MDTKKTVKPEMLSIDRFNLMRRNNLSRGFTCGRLLIEYAGFVKVRTPKTLAGSGLKFYVGLPLAKKCRCKRRIKSSLSSFPRRQSRRPPRICFPREGELGK